MSNKNELAAWRGKFGDEYVTRNPITDDAIKAREMFMHLVLHTIYVENKEIPKDILEIGCGSGLNLIALNSLYKTAGRPLNLNACEPNEKAREIVKHQDIKVNLTDDDIFNLSFDINSQDLVFTSGVLIHVNPDRLQEAIFEIYKSTKKYILIAEYFAPSCEEITYQDKKQMLWRNDFGKIFMDSFPLRVISYGFLWKPVTMLDNITWWLFQKVN